MLKILFIFGKKLSLFHNILSADVQRFIHEHDRDDVRALVLKHAAVNGVPMSIIAEQISGRKKAKEKIPLLVETAGIVYPPNLNLEQSSSQKTALYKNTLLKDVQSKDRCVDLTGGFGIDAFFFSKVFREVLYVEPNENLLRLVEHNHKQLEADNILHQVNTAEKFLTDALSKQTKLDLAYIDPSRRNKINKKVFSLTECEPDVTTLLDTIFKITDVLLIKASPLLDLHQGLLELRFVQKIIVVAVENEVREVLFLCVKNFEGEPLIQPINLLKDEKEEALSFSFSEERAATSTFSDPQKFLYEPNAAILKAGAFKMISQKFQLAKLHPSTHLYTSSILLENFPGRVFGILETLKASPKSVASQFPEGKANITTRNYPLSVEELKKKTGLKDGGSNYLIGFSGQQEKFLVAAKRLQ
ncbi:THUMP-like domain-containing protein [Chryseolinea serpens]|uniref:THUMP-like domain-containing protein n=1 Tax=Chryseolinea serpens TaxID=947013 RepID=UPI0015BADE79|nr:RsmD family RNA methyltransferase [Chryseolinea serpens]